jgi:hypothetical protein
MKTVPESKEKTWCMGPYAGVDYITSPFADSNTFTTGRPMPKPTFTQC